jgi:hypothetical protein
MYDAGNSVPIPPDSGRLFRSGAPESGTVVTDVAGAAAMLGISESAVLKRLRAGTLDGCKFAGRWQVTLPASDSAGTERTPGTGFRERNRNPDGTRNIGPEGPGSVPAVSAAARGQLAVLVDELLAPIVARHGAEMREAGETIGRFQTEGDQAARERDAALAEVERLRAAREPLSASPEAPESPPPAKSGGGLRGWLRRLLGA